MSRLRTIFFSLLLLLSALPVLAQDKPSGFDETMRSNGRIYVVVAVMVTILTGLVLYLVRLDRKITKLEKD